uniref:Uncharacterized protein n=1 Tax=Caenorhabditis japonica TaxID=281687 RepID=A0A8R1IRZ4_CAEJA
MDRKEILRIFETKEWDPDERARTYVNKTKLEGFRDNLNLRNIAIPWESGDRDIIRSDGLLATIRMEPRRFYFLVWHDRFPK